MTDNKPVDTDEPVVPNGRQFNFKPWYLLAAIVLGLNLVAWIAWDLQIEQITLLGIGSSALLLSAFVWLYGIIGYSDSEGGGGPEVTKVRELPLPRELVAPLLFAVGVAFVLAGTPTDVGVALSGPANASVILYKFAKESYEIFLSAVFWAVFISGWVFAATKRGRELFVGMVFLTAFLGLGGGIFYVFYRVNPEGYRQLWDDYLAPFRFVIRLVT